MGAPPPVYNGGLLRATVRYFDADEKRPGLPADIAALVDEVAADRVGVEMVNLSGSQTRRVVVQAGAFGEHQFLLMWHTLRRVRRGWRGTRGCGYAEKRRGRKSGW